jgi:hypothetical protein
VEIELTADGAGYTRLTASAGLGFASTFFDALDSKLAESHPAVKAGATNGSGGMLVWTADRNAEIVAAYNEIAANDAHLASQARQAANLASADADTVNGDINKLTV